MTSDLQVGDIVIPSAALRAWGRSGFDFGARVTRVRGKHVWARPIKSTRYPKVFGWVWRTSQEYHSGREDFIRVAPELWPRIEGRYFGPRCRACGTRHAANVACRPRKVSA